MEWWCEDKTGWVLMRAAGSTHASLIGLAPPTFGKNGYTELTVDVHLC